MAASTALREVSLALGEWFITRDTVATETPASLATSFIVAIFASTYPRVIAYIPQSYGKPRGLQVIARVSVASPADFGRRAGFFAGKSQCVSEKYG
ncbi:protein of unknown function [Serratia sp. Tan611]|nr:protein of unknown function [Serratia sp. Tan611]